MAIPPPSSDDLAKIAAQYGFTLSPGDLESCRGLVTGALGSYDAVQRLYEARLPAPPARPHEWPGAAGNELGAWYVITEITGGGDGPLTGRRVAVKDNIAVAGVPMMNGSAAVQGFVPLRDATVVTRLLAAGATIAGKAVCEDLCFSGGSHTSRTGPVRNPWDRSRTTGGSSSGSAALVAAGAGAVVSEVSVPWHRDAMHVWTVIATDGVVTQMVDGNGFGMNWPGRYDPDLMEHYRRGRMTHADELPETAKASIIAGRHSIGRHGGRYYAMARNLALDLTAAYDAALGAADVLVLPTLPITATPIPAPTASREES